MNARLLREDVAIEFPALQRVQGRSALGTFHYVPVLFASESGAHKVERILLEILAVLLGEVQGTLPRTGVVYFGRKCRSRKVKFSPDLRTGKDRLQAALRLCRGEGQPRLLLNDNCSICEFSARCRDQAVREDNISLLRGIGQKKIEAYARKGILTLTQLAHTFQPRRKGKRSSRPSTKRYHPSMHWRCATVVCTCSGRVVPAVLESLRDQVYPEYARLADINPEYWVMGWSFEAWRLTADRDNQFTPVLMAWAQEFNIQGEGWILEGALQTLSYWHQFPCRRAALDISGFQQWNAVTGIISAEDHRFSFSDWGWIPCW